MDHGVGAFAQAGEGGLVLQVAWDPVDAFARRLLAAGERADVVGQPPVRAR
jgi:hypothetical protein